MNNSFLRIFILFFIVVPLMVIGSFVALGFGVNIVRSDLSQPEKLILIGQVLFAFAFIAVSLLFLLMDQHSWALTKGAGRINLAIRCKRILTKGKVTNLSFPLPIRVDVTKGRRFFLPLSFFPYFMLLGPTGRLEFRDKTGKSLFQSRYLYTLKSVQKQAGVLNEFLSDDRAEQYVTDIGEGRLNGPFAAVFFALGAGLLATVIMHKPITSWF